MNLAICASLGIVERRRDARVLDECEAGLRSPEAAVQDYAAPCNDLWGER